MEINMHHSNVVIATFTAQGRVGCNVMANAFSAGKSGEAFEFQLNFVEKVIDFFSGNVRQTAVKLMNDLGRQMREIRNPEATEFEKESVHTKAFEIMEQLEDMVDRGDIGEFCKLFHPLLILFKAARDNAPAEEVTIWSTFKPAKIVSLDERLRRQKEKCQAEEQLILAEKMKIVPIEQAPEDWVVVAKPPIILDGPSPGFQVPGVSVYEIESGKVSDKLKDLTWADINPDAELTWEIVEQPKRVIVPTISEVEVEGITPDPTANPYDQEIDYTANKKPLKTSMEAPSKSNFLGGLFR